MTEAQIEKIINDQVMKQILAAQKNDQAKVSFVAGSGTLKISAAANVLGVRVSVGEINIYKVTAALTGSILLCRRLAIDTVSMCAKQAFENIADVVMREFKPEADSHAVRDK